LVESFKQGRVNGAGFGFADTLAFLAQIIASHPSFGYRGNGLLEYAGNGLATDLPVAPVKPVADQDGDDSAS
jgi:hypothetical protein